MTKQDLNILMEHYESLEDPKFRDDIIEDLTYLTTFGLEDEIRDNTVVESIQLIKYGQIIEQNVEQVKKGQKNQVNVRMVTGDHIETAKAIALRVGIVSQEEKDLDGIALTGALFRERIGKYQKYWDKEYQEWRIKFSSSKRFNSVKSKLRIIARATAEDKLLLIQGIKQEGGLVAMSGYSTSDATALKMANVGLSMGSGCTIAKDNADLVILDNDFKSINYSI